MTFGVAQDFTVSPARRPRCSNNGLRLLLLIAAALSATNLSSSIHLRLVGLDVLVEVHDEAELAIALDVGRS